MYVVDAANYDQLVCSFIEMQNIVQLDDAFMKPILLVFNKIDSLCGFSQETINYVFDLKSLKCKDLTVCYVSALTGENMETVS